MIRHFRKKEEVLRNTFDIVSKLTGRGGLMYNYELNHKFSMYFNYVAIFFLLGNGHGSLFDQT